MVYMIKTCARLLFQLQEKSRKLIYKVFRETIIKKSFAECGRNVHIAEKCNFKGIENIYIGFGSSLGCGSTLYTTRANIIIKEKVVTGPNITIITGNHKIDGIGKCIVDIRDEEKDISCDENVIIERDVWIGANVTILKGVTIAEGCVIAAGAVVTQDTKPYSIVGGVPAKFIKWRFSESDLKTHLDIIYKND